MTARTLVVIVPGMVHSGLHRWQPLIRRLKDELGEGTVWCLYEHRRAWMSRARARDTARSLAARIHAEWVQAGGFDQVMLVGHSFGGLLVKQAFVMGRGFDEIDPRPSPWADAVKRIVLLACISRGIGSGSGGEPDRGWRRSLSVLAWLFSAVPWLRRLIVYDIMRGSGFVTNLRIQWMRCFAETEDPPQVIQLLGDHDAVVMRQDSLDVDQLGTGWHVVVPDTTHDAILDIDRDAKGPARYALIRAALVDDTQIGENLPRREGPAKVAFVMHGIRSNNSTWVRQLADQIRLRDPTMTVIEPTYGFFTALKFALPSARRRHARWFQDQYAQAFVQNPGAEFHFVGHSNGTYVFGESLGKITAMRFERAVLVASVLPSQYDWATRVAQSQIKSFCNLRSNRDIPVSILCSALRGLGMSDVGTGGFDGFHYPDPAIKQELFWYDGGHGKALEQTHLPHIVDFLLSGPTQRLALPSCCSSAAEPPWQYGLLSRVAPWIARGAVLGGLFGVYELVSWAPDNALAVIAGLLGALVVRDLV